MTMLQKMSLLLLRLSLGSLFLYAGLTKVFDPAWSAAFYLKSAKTFPDFYGWFLQPDILPITNFLNMWGLTFVGAALLLGIFVRLAGVSGAVLMLLYYFPVLNGWYPNAYSFIVDEHIVYAFAFLVLAAFRAGRVFGLERWCMNLPICGRFPRVRTFIG